jgi:KUP system potassium uptake protein
MVARDSSIESGAEARDSAAVLAPGRTSSLPPGPVSTPSGHPHGSVAKLALLATGVVFGDIGTSPLYALKECIDPDHGVAATESNLLGLLSLVFWSLTMVVTVKYLTFIMRADNQGEGGILALLALAPRPNKADAGRIGWIGGLVIFGAALLYGDGVITPAISVLSAVEGLAVGTSRLTPVIIPLTVAVLFGLFWVQKRGTARIGRVFGPIMVVWFFAISIFGLREIVQCPSVLRAVYPGHALSFLAHHGWQGFVVLGSVVLVITGGEALYADMGHFGRSPIRVSWFVLVMPALLLNYFGQAAGVLRHPEAAANPFYGIVPEPLIFPMVGLATIATVIASQALISGAYSLTRQAVQLGFCPRVTIVHTSGDAEGQIYIPEVNFALALGCIWLVLMFKESSALAAAYGIAVTGTMAITSVVYFVVLNKTWHWPLWKCLPLVATFLAFDIPFFAANALKFFHGGWFPIGIATLVYVTMTTWKTGRAYLGRSLAERILPIDAFISDLAAHRPERVRGTAVFMASNPNGVPVVLLHHWKHNQVLHEAVVLLSVVSEPIPEVPSRERLTVRDCGHGLFQILARYGFMETPNVPRIMSDAARFHGMKYDPGRTSYFLGRETLLTSGTGKMFRWRKGLFTFISRNSRSATQYFGIPPDRVVELGMQINL